MHLFRKLRERLAFWRWYLLDFKPIFGADGSTDGGEGGEGSGEGAGSEGSAAGSEGGDGNGGGEGSGEGSGSGGDGGDGGSSESGAGEGEGDDTVTLPKSEAERLRREVANAAREKRERERKAAEEAGDHQKVVQGVESERDEAIEERDQARKELATVRAEIVVSKVAGTLNFHDVEDAVLRVPAEVAERGEAAVEKHLRDLIKKSPHLVGEGSQRSGAPVGGGGSGGGGGGAKLTKQDVEGMSRDEMVKRWDEVQEAMAE